MRVWEFIVNHRHIFVAAHSFVEAAQMISEKYDDEDIESVQKTDKHFLVAE